MTLGELLSAAGEWCYGLWPVRIIQDWEQGVRVFSGRATTLLTSTNGMFGSGIHFFVPLLGSVEVEETNICVVETDLQTVSTSDGKEATFSIGVKYRIRDLKATYTRIHDHEDTILEQVRASAGNAVSGLSWEEMPTKLGPAVESAVKSRVRGWGIEIIEASPINLIDAQAIRLIQDSAG